jgi:hypothetical protein
MIGDTGVEGARGVEENIDVEIPHGNPTNILPWRLVILNGRTSTLRIKCARFLGTMEISDIRHAERTHEASGQCVEGFFIRGQFGE